MIFDVEAAVNYCRQFGKVIAIGHSMGGRLILTSNADFKIALAPALSNEYNHTTLEKMKTMWRHKVRDEYDEDFFEIFNQIPQWKALDGNQACLIYAQNDIPEIIFDCKKMESKTEVCEINQAYHSDIYMQEETYAKISEKVSDWLMIKV